MSRMGRGTIYLGVSSIFFMAAAYLTNIWLGRHLGPTDYGIYGVLTALMTAVGVMGVNGLPQAVSKFVAEEDSQSESILMSGLKVQIGFTALIAILFALLAPVAAGVFHDQRFIGYMLTMAFVFPFYGLFALYGGYHNGRHDFKRQAFMNIMYSAAKLVLVIGLAILFGLYGVIVAFAVAPLVALSAGWRWPRSSAAFPVERIIKYALPLTGFAALAALQLSIDLFSVKALVGNERAAGYYAAAQSVSLIPYMAMSALGQVLFPGIARLAIAGQHAQAALVISQAFRYMLLILLPAAAVIIGSAPGLIELLFGVAYLPAIPVLRVLVLGYVALAVFAMFAAVLNGAGRAKTAMLLAVLGVMIALILCIMLIPRFGTVGAALATGVSASLVMIVSLRLTRAIFSYDIQVITLIKIITASLLLLGLAWLPMPILLLPGWWIFLGVVYFIALRITGEIADSDLARMKALVSRRKGHIERTK